MTELQALLYALAEELPTWRPYALFVLAAIFVGSLWLAAAALEDRW